MNVMGIALRFNQGTLTASLFVITCHPLLLAVQNHASHLAFNLTRSGRPKKERPLFHDGAFQLPKKSVNR